MPNRHAGRFAEAFARFHDCDHGLCVANGTVSLEIALEAAGVEAGSEVVVPAYTFEATAAAVLFAGCVPVFADITPDTYCLDPAAFEAASVRARAPSFRSTSGCASPTSTPSAPSPIATAWR